MFVSQAFAQTAAGGQAAAGGVGSTVFFFVQMAAILALFYFLMIRPQQKRMKALRDSIAAVKKGDSVITGGGLVGKVTKVDEAFAEVEIAPNVKVRVVKSTIAEVTPLGGAKPAND